MTEPAHDCHDHEHADGSGLHSLLVLGVTAGYGAKPAIENIDLRLSCGKCVGLLGPNGAGKTTLLKAIAGLVAMQSGVIRMHGATPARMARDIAYLPQREEIDWQFPVTVRGLVEMGRYPDLGDWRPWRYHDEHIVGEAIALLGLTDVADRQISELSGGQQQRAFIARAWAQQAHVYLLDEPFTGLDRNATKRLAATLRQLVDEGKLILASHHHLDSVPDLFDDVVLLNREVIETGPTRETYTQRNIARTFSAAA